MAKNPDYGYNHNNKARWISLDDQYDICEIAAPGIAKAILHKACIMAEAVGDASNEREIVTLVYGICLNAYTEIQLKFVYRAFGIQDEGYPFSTDDGHYALHISRHVGEILKRGDIRAEIDKLI